MENNTDKKIADKLKGIEMPYEPEAWQEMEALLDKKKKRRVIFWWFFGSGIAACLLLGGLLWQGMPKHTEQQSKASEITENRAEVKEPVTSVQSAITTTEGAPVVSLEGGKNEITTASANNGNIKAAETKNGQKNNAVAAENQLKKVETNRQKDKKQKAEKVRTLEKTEKAPIAIVSPKQRKTEKVKELVAGTEEPSANKTEEVSPAKPEAKEEVIALNGTAAEEAKKTEQASGQNAEMPVTTENVGQQTETIEETKAVNVEEKKEEKAENATAKKDEKVDGKKKVFSFHLGARTDFYDVIPLHEGARDTFVKAKGVGRFAYMVGPDMEFMFGKHFSIYTGVLYSYNSYRINNPVVSPSALDLPDSVNAYSSIVCKSFTSTAHEIVLPVGFKGYPYVSDNFRISIAAGIFNHIKIKEKFNTEVVTTPYTSMNAPLVGEDKFVTTTSNPFTNAYTDMYDNSPTTQALEKRQSQANWFSVSGTSRYYASFYASIGAEVILKKRLRILVEPIYRMSISTIGEQQQRLHSFGGSIGFKYQLGK